MWVTKLFHILKKVCVMVKIVPQSESEGIKSYFLQPNLGYLGPIFLA